MFYCSRFNSFSLTLCKSKHRKRICTYLSSYLPRLHNKLDYVRLSRNLYIDYVHLSRNLHIHYVHLGRNLYIHYVRLRPTQKVLQSLSWQCYDDRQYKIERRIERDLGNVRSINQPNSNPGTHSPSTYFPILLFYLVAHVAVLFNSDVDKFYIHNQLKKRFATLYLFSAPPQAYAYYLCSFSPNSSSPFICSQRCEE